MASQTCDVCGVVAEPSEALVSRERASIHEPLPAGSYIRILRLETGQSSHPRQGSLRSVLLDDVRGSYYPLSDVWGPALPSRDIIVNEQILAIQDNLFCFLQRLLLFGTPLEVWVDAICMGQSSTVEKNHQVQQMHMIYSSGHTTLVWLGACTPAIQSLITEPTRHGKLEWTDKVHDSLVTESRTPAPWALPPLCRHIGGVRAPSMETRASTFGQTK